MAFKRSGVQFPLAPKRQFPLAPGILVMKEILEIFWAFFVIGASTFGGGYAMIPVLQRELISKRSWINMEEVMDYFTIAQITPGIIAVNVATFVGFKRKGLLGGIIATIALILPGAALMIIISLFLRRFAEYRLVQHAFTGIRVAVCALILDTIVKLFKGLFRDFRPIILFIIALVLSLVFSISPVFIILGACFAGFLLYNRKNKEQP